MIIMGNADKTKEQLLTELEELRKHVAMLEEFKCSNDIVHNEMLQSRELYRSIWDASPN